jgi:hypothetical protein
MIVLVMMLLAYFVGDLWKGIETDMITGPAWTLERRAFSAAGRAACANPKSIACCFRPPQDDGDSASQRGMMLTPLAPQPHPRRRSL